MSFSNITKYNNERNVLNHSEKNRLLLRCSGCFWAIHNLYPPFFLLTSNSLHFTAVRNHCGPLAWHSHKKAVLLHARHAPFLPTRNKMLNLKSTHSGTFVVDVSLFILCKCEKITPSRSRQTGRYEMTNFLCWIRSTVCSRREKQTWLIAIDADQIWEVQFCSGYNDL